VNIEIPLQKLKLKSRLRVTGYVTRANGVKRVSRGREEDGQWRPFGTHK
jgi:hypothetical protein